MKQRARDARAHPPDQADGWSGSRTKVKVPCLRIFRGIIRGSSNYLYGETIDASEPHVHVAFYGGFGSLRGVLRASSIDLYSFLAFGALFAL